MEILPRRQPKLSVFLHLVNPANSLLVLGGGVAGAILRAGGPSIQQECAAWVKVHGEVSQGHCAYTGAGKLFCRYVLHLVGPRYSGRGPLPDVILSNAIRSVLHQAESLEVKSLSIPAVSSGLFGYPKRQCAETIVRSTVGWIREKFHPYPLIIRFINVDQETVTHFEEVVEEFARSNNA